MFASLLLVVAGFGSLSLKVDMEPPWVRPVLFLFISKWIFFAVFVIAVE